MRNLSATYFWVFILTQSFQLDTAAQLALSSGLCYFVYLCVAAAAYPVLILVLHCLTAAAAFSVKKGVLARITCRIVNRLQATPSQIWKQSVYNAKLQGEEWPIHRHRSQAEGCFEGLEGDISASSAVRCVWSFCCNCPGHPGWGAGWISTRCQGTVRNKMKYTLVLDIPDVLHVTRDDNKCSVCQFWTQHAWDLAVDETFRSSTCAQRRFDTMCCRHKSR